MLSLIWTNYLRCEIYFIFWWSCNAFGPNSHGSRHEGLWFSYHCKYSNLCWKSLVHVHWNKTCVWQTIHGWYQDCKYSDYSQCLITSYLFGAKPLSEPVLAYFQLDSIRYIWVPFYFEIKCFHSIKCIWKWHMQNDVHFVWASLC